MGGVCALGAADGAFAAKVTVTPAVALSETYTDNVFLLPQGFEEADWVTQVTPSLNIVATGARASARLNYDPSILMYARQNETDTRQSVDGALQIEPVEDHLFIDSTVSLADRFLSSNRGISVSDRNLSADRRQVLTMTTAPRWQEHIGPWVNAALGYSFSRIDYGKAIDSDKVPDIPTGFGDVNVSDESRHMVTLNLLSGDNFQRLRWNINAVWSKEVRDDSTAANIANKYVRANGSYSVNRLVALTAMLGYQDYGSRGGTLSGLDWTIGADLTPSRRTSLSVTYGRKTQNTHFTVRGNWQPAARTQLSISYDETYQTFQSLALQQAIDTGQQPITQPQAGGAFNFFNNPTLDFPGFGTTNDIFLQKRYSFSASHQFRLSAVSASAYREQRTASGFDQKATGATLGYQRTFSRMLSGSLTGSYIHREDLDVGPYDVYTASATVNRRIVGQASLFLSYALTKRTSSAPLLRLEENAFTAGLSARF
jgi:uncharacterized protein (PEP-CTERM system associated)